MYIGQTGPNEDTNERETFASQHATESRDPPLSKDPSPSGDRESTEAAVKSESDFTADLLDGISVLFTDYQDCMDEETMDKWKQVCGCVVGGASNHIKAFLL